jgi:metal-dependent amidase/aminoacylase/carboxypeptidase family protein
MKKIGLFLLLVSSIPAFAQTKSIKEDVSKKADALQDQIIAWRRDFHEHPELGNHEVRTSGIIAKYLQSLGLDVKTGVATTGVVAILRGGRL